eukprot:PhF_6_TR36106/c0_g1_i1/m.52426
MLKEQPTANKLRLLHDRRLQVEAAARSLTHQTSLAGTEMLLTDAVAHLHPITKEEFENLTAASSTQQQNEMSEIDTLNSQVRELKTALNSAEIKARQAEVRATEAHKELQDATLQQATSATEQHDNLRKQLAEAKNQLISYKRLAEEVSIAIGTEPNSTLEHLSEAVRELADTNSVNSSTLKHAKAEAKSAESKNGELSAEVE